MGNVNLKQCCVAEEDHRSELETTKDKDFKVKFRPIQSQMNDKSFKIKTSENPKTILAKYYNFMRNRSAVLGYLNKWRIENLNIFVTGIVFLFRHT